LAGAFSSRLLIHVEVTMSADSQLWYVKVQDGTVYPATLEQIDDAFNGGRINEDTLVLAAGETRWKRLGELAGLDAPESETPASVAPVAASIAPPASVQPSSLRPLSVDLEDSDAAAMRPKSRKKRVLGTLGVAVVIGAAVFAVNRSSMSTSHSSAAAAPPPPVAAVSDPVVMAPAAAPSAEPPRFSEEQKQKLLAADRARDEQVKARLKLREGSSHHGSRSYKSQGFTSKGDKFDPMNNSL
jgi:hypothetical protein